MSKGKLILKLAHTAAKTEKTPQHLYDDTVQVAAISIFLSSKRWNNQKSNSNNKQKAKITYLTRDGRAYVKRFLEKEKAYNKHIKLIQPENYQ